MWMEKIVGVVAGYTDNIVDEMVYIAMVSVLQEMQNHGITKKLIENFCNKCKEKILKKYIYIQTIEIV